MHQTAASASAATPSAPASAFTMRRTGCESMPWNGYRFNDIRGNQELRRGQCPWFGRRKSDDRRRWSRGAGQRQDDRLLLRATAPSAAATAPDAAVGVVLGATGVGSVAVSVQARRPLLDDRDPHLLVRARHEPDVLELVLEVAVEPAVLLAVLLGGLHLALVNLALGGAHGQMFRLGHRDEGRVHT